MGAPEESPERAHPADKPSSVEEVLVMAECPVCGGEVSLESDTVVGELLECPDCGTELEVLDLEPAKLGEAPETEEDWGE